VIRSDIITSSSKQLPHDDEGEDGHGDIEEEDDDREVIVVLIDGSSNEKRSNRD